LIVVSLDDWHHKAQAILRSFSFSLIHCLIIARSDFNLQVSSPIRQQTKILNTSTCLPNDLSHVPSHTLKHRFKLNACQGHCAFAISGLLNKASFKRRHSFTSPLIRQHELSYFKGESPLPCSFLHLWCSNELHQLVSVDL
jgi:hypothetical protein